MNKLVKLSLVFISICLLTACASTQNYQQILMQWQGENIQQLINSWGYPDAAIKLPNGHSVYMYTRQHSYITPPTPTMTPTIINAPGTPMAATTYNGNFIGGQTIMLYCRTWFETDTKGTIVNTRFQGNNCVASTRDRWAPQG